MRKIKILLVVFIMMLMTSCDALQVTVGSDNYMDRNPYNYNRIDMVYRQNPQYFYDNYYNHPYYIRYKRDYHERHNHYPLKYYGTDKKYRKYENHDNRGSNNKYKQKYYKRKKH